MRQFIPAHYRIQKIGIVMGVVFILAFSRMHNAQSFYFGADLSYVNELENCGAAFKVNGILTDPYTLFADYGCNLVRLRLWHTPSWYDALNDGRRYSDLADVSQSIRRARQAGLEVLLAFHLSDNWADPGNQVAPSAWWPVVDDLEVLSDSLYNYIFQALSQLAADSLLPDIVQIGNETNRGILLSKAVNDAGWTLDWPRNAVLFNTAIHAVRHAEEAFDASIQIAIHIANPSEAVWYYQQFKQHGVTDFDIMGLSYYPQWHHHDLQTVGQYIATFRQQYPDKRVMVLETGIPWTTSFADAAANILSQAPEGYGPPSPAHQLEWLTELTQIVIDNGGHGVVFWEPAWVSTGCHTQWGQGSHWENCAFFDFQHELIDNGGIGWMQHEYKFPVSTDDIVEKDVISLYPNPAKGVLFLETGTEITKYMMYDHKGKCINVYGIRNNDQRIAIDIRSLDTGMYFLVVSCSDGTIVAKPFIAIKN